MPLTQHVRQVPGTLCQAGFDVVSMSHTISLSGTGAVNGSEIGPQRRRKAGEAHFSDSFLVFPSTAVQAVQDR